MIVITVRLSGYLKQQGLSTGFAGGSLELGDDATVTDALAAIGVTEKTPWLVTHNGELAVPDTRLEEGDVLVIIPPISGGTD